MNVEQVTSLDELMAAANSRRCVTCPSLGSRWQRVPAAFVVAMQARTVHGLIARGMWIYRPNTTK